MAKVVSYIRVSTAGQGASGLGADAQREAVRRFITSGDWEQIGEVVEVESGRKARPQLESALKEAKRLGACLVVAKLDRLSRNVRYFLEVLDDSGVQIRFAEFADIDPNTDEGRMLLVNMANFAEFEGRRIGTRTRAALAAARARNVKLGKAGAANLKPNIEQRQQAAKAFAERLRGVIEGMTARGLSQRAMAKELSQLGVRTAAGKTTWSQAQIQRVLQRISSN